MRRSFDYDLHAPWMVPTLEDQLEVEFWSIVSDCRAILSGTLTPRKWSDISSTWDKVNVDPFLHMRGNKVRSARSSASAKAAWAHRPRSKESVKRPRHFHKMVRILEASGRNVWEARIMARTILGGEIDK